MDTELAPHHILEDLVYLLVDKANVRKIDLIYSTPSQLRSAMGSKTASHDCYI